MNKNPVRLRLACFFGGTQASLSIQYVLDGFAFLWTGFRFTGKHSFLVQNQSCNSFVIDVMNVIPL